MPTAPDSDSIVVAGPKDGVLLKLAVENEIEDFDRWFTSPIASGGCGNAPLVDQEKALLRTYLIARLTGRVSPRAGS